MLEIIVVLIIVLLYFHCFFIKRNNYYNNKSTGGTLSSQPQLYEAIFQILYPNFIPNNEELLTIFSAYNVVSATAGNDGRQIILKFNSQEDRNALITDHPIVNIADCGTYAAQPI